MQKPAHNDYPLHPLIQMRWSPRAFSPRPVEAEKLQSVLEAARWSASCFNEQPWRFIVATLSQPEEHARLLSCCVASVQRWAQNAPVLMLTAARTRFEGHETPNHYAWHDIGMATQNMTLQATSMGLWVHPFAGIDADKARALYAVPEPFEIVTGIALGYYGALEALVEKDQLKEQQQRTRKPLQDMVFSGMWSEPAAFVK